MMKTYKLDSLKRIHRVYSQRDVNSLLCSKTWLLFEEVSEKDTYIFQVDGSLIITTKSQSQNAQWEYNSSTRTITIKTPTTSYRMHVSYVDDLFLVLQMENSEEYVFFVDAEENVVLQPSTFPEIVTYFQQLDLNAESPERDLLMAKRRKVKDLLKHDELYNLLLQGFGRINRRINWLSLAFFCFFVVTFLVFHYLVKNSESENVFVTFVIVSAVLAFFFVVYWKITSNKCKQLEQELLAYEERMMHKLHNE